MPLRAMSPVERLAACYSRVFLRRGAVSGRSFAAILAADDFAPEFSLVVTEVSSGDVVGFLLAERPGPGVVLVAAAGLDRRWRRHGLSLHCFPLFCERAVREGRPTGRFVTGSTRRAQRQVYPSRSDRLYDIVISGENNVRSSITDHSRSGAMRSPWNGTSKAVGLPPSKKRIDLSCGEPFNTKNDRPSMASRSRPRPAATSMRNSRPSTELPNRYLPSGDQVAA